MLGQLWNNFRRGSKAPTPKSSETAHRDEDMENGSWDPVTVAIYRSKSSHPAYSSRRNRDRLASDIVTEAADILAGTFVPVKITHPGFTLTHEYILKALEHPRADFEIVEIFKNFKWAPKVSEQHIRTQRKKLVELGYIEYFGEDRLTTSNRKAKVWKVAKNVS